MDFYQLLGIENNCSKQEIKQAFYNQIRKIHPDKEGNTQIAQQLIEAYKVLTDNREEYDKSIKQQIKYCINEKITNDSSFYYECEQCGEPNHIQLEWKNVIVECIGCNLKMQIYQI